MPGFAHTKYKNPAHASEMPSSAEELREYIFRLPGEVKKELYSDPKVSDFCPCDSKAKSCFLFQLVEDFVKPNDFDHKTGRVIQRKVRQFDDMNWAGKEFGWRPKEEAMKLITKRQTRAAKKAEDLKSTYSINSKTASCGVHLHSRTMDFKLFTTQCMVEEDGSPFKH
jgi:hypothetical protein